MKVIRKIKLTFFTLLVLVSSMLVSVNAVSLSPSSGTLPANTTSTIQIIASGPAGSEGVQIRLTLTGNATITGYTPPAGAEWGPGGIGVCSGGTMYTSTQVCVDLANTGIIASGTSLGSIQVTTEGSGTVIITRDSTNGYLVGKNIEFQTGTAGTYTIGGSVYLPNTAINDDPRTLIIGGSLIVMMTGVMIYMVYPDIRVYFVEKRWRQNLRFGLDMLKLGHENDKNT